jgi:hypothetical protein
MTTATMGAMAVEATIIALMIAATGIAATTRPVNVGVRLPPPG